MRCYPGACECRSELEADLRASLAREHALRKGLERATYVARNLHSMIPRQLWRDSGGDDGQGHYEGEYHAEQLATEIQDLATLASSPPQGRYLTDQEAEEIAVVLRSELCGHGTDECPSCAPVLAAIALLAGSPPGHAANKEDT